MASSHLLALAAVFPASPQFRGLLVGDDALTVNRSAGFILSGIEILLSWPNFAVIAKQLHDCAIGPFLAIWALAFAAPLEISDITGFDTFERAPDWLSLVSLLG